MSTDSLQIAKMEEIKLASKLGTGGWSELRERQDNCESCLEKFDKPNR